MTGRIALRGAFALLLMLALAACSQPVPVDKRDYIGHWQGEGVLLVILAIPLGPDALVEPGTRAEPLAPSMDEAVVSSAPVIEGAG